MRKRGPKVRRLETTEELQAAAVVEVVLLAVEGVAPSSAQYNVQRSAGAPCVSLLRKRGVRYADIVRLAGLEMPKAMATMVRRYEERVGVPAAVENYCASEPWRKAVYEEQSEGLRVLRSERQEYSYEAGPGVLVRVEREICVLR